MSIELDPDSDYFGMKLNRNTDGRVILAFGSVVAKKGDHVRYLDTNGHEWEREMARVHFKAGDLLTVESLRVGRDYSRYSFKEVSGDWNTVMFSNPLVIAADSPSQDSSASNERPKGTPNPSPPNEV